MGVFSKCQQHPCTAINQNFFLTFHDKKTLKFCIMVFSLTYLIMWRLKTKPATKTFPYQHIIYSYRVITLQSMLHQSLTVPMSALKVMFLR